MSRDDRRSQRVSTARRRADEHTSGYSTTCLKIPEGVSFFEAKPGMYTVDIVPYTVNRGKNDAGGNPFAERGELHWERTYYRYRQVGPAGKPYIATGKTFNKPDPIQDYISQEARKADSDAAALKKLNPQERQIFLLSHHEDLAKGLKIWDCAFNNFGKLLDQRIQTSPESFGWDRFYFPEQDGMSLRLTIIEDSFAGTKFSNVKAIDFVPRSGPLPDSIVNHGYQLDDFLIELPYENLKKIFFGMDLNETEQGSTASETTPSNPLPNQVATPPAVDSCIACGGTGQSTSGSPCVPCLGKGTKAPPQGVVSNPPTTTAVTTPPTTTGAAPGAGAGVARGTSGYYEGRKVSVVRVVDDQFLTLMDENDELIKNVPFANFSTQPQTTATAEPAKPPVLKTVQEMGITKDSILLYKGTRRCTIARINPDNVTMTLMDDNDDLIKEVPTSDVGVIETKAATSPSGPPQNSTPPQPPAAEDAKKLTPDDGDWDEGWGKGKK